MSSLQLIMQGALAAHRAGKLDAAIQGYRMALAAQPNHPAIMNQWGIAELQRGNATEAQRLFEASLRLAPQQPDVLCNLAYLLNQRGEHTRAVEACDRSLALEQPNPGALTNKGEALRALGRFDEALTCFEAALSTQPDRADYLYNRANTLFALHRLGDAIRDFQAALKLAPQVRQIRINLAAAHIQNKEVSEAIALLEEAGRLEPSDPLVWLNLGAAYDTARESAKAEKCFRQVISLQPGNALGHANLAQLLSGMRRYTDAIHHFTEALRLDPTLHWCRGGRLMARRHICDLEDEEAEQALIRTALMDGHLAMTPFEAIVTQDDPALLLRAIQNFVTNRLGGGKNPQPVTATRTDIGTETRKIRVGYFSADWGEHPVTYLMEPVLRAHDRSVIEVHVFLTGRQPPSPALESVKRAADHFHDVAGQTVAAIQAASKSRGIDIAIDLGGHTLNNRADLFAARVAPVQAGYLGFPGPSGIPNMDYILADDALIPSELRQHYAERVAWVDAYQASADWPVVDTESCREQYDIPADAFVFCSFGNFFKVSPPLLRLWAEILTRTPDSLLWISVETEEGRRNLHKQLKSLGVDAARVRFADRVSRSAYLQRLALGDLYLDTTPSSSGTTATDALCVGLPILTFTGQTFSARMCTSVLRSAGMEELIAHSASEYVDRAVDWYVRPQELKVLRQRMTQSLRTSRLFDTARMARQLESIYQQMWEQQRTGAEFKDLRAH